MPCITAHKSTRYGNVGDLVTQLEPTNVLFLGIFYVCDNVAPPWEGLKRIMFLTLLTVGKMVVWNTRQFVVLHGDMLSHHDLIAFFKHQLLIKDTFLLGLLINYPSSTRPIQLHLYFPSSTRPVRPHFNYLTSKPDQPTDDQLTYQQLH